MPAVRYYTNAVTTLSSINGKIWNDRPNSTTSPDFDGTDDKTGVENVGGKNYDRDYDNDFVYQSLTVRLKKCGPVRGETQADVNSWNSNMPTTVTDSNGDYSFSNIPTGAYAVQVVTAIPNLSLTTSLNKGIDCDTSYNYTFFNSLFYNGVDGGIAPGNNVNYDIIYYFTPQVSADFWLDTNRNGILDSWESYRPYSANLDMANSLGIVNPNNLKYFSNGYNNYNPSVTPDNYSVTLLNNSGNTNIPTDYTIIGANSYNINTLLGSQSVSFGITPTANSSLNGKVFIDRNGDNIFTANGEDNNAATSYDNDATLPSRTVNLYYGQNFNQFISSSVTDSNGDYSFNNLAEGQYSVKVLQTAPAGTECTGCESSFVVGKDSSVSQNLRYNYNGKLRLSSFYDTITNFVRDDEFETDVNEGQFTLIAPDGSQVGNPVSPIGKDNNSYYYNQYQFNQLMPGTYSIQMSGMPSAIRGYSIPDSITLSPSQTAERDYPFTALTNNSIAGDVFIDKETGVNQGLNNVYNPNGGDNNSSTIYDNDLALNNTQVSIVGPLGTYNTTTNQASYTFNSLPSGKYKLYKLVNGGVDQAPNVILDNTNPNFNNIILSSYTANNTLRNNNANTDNFSYKFTNEISAYCYEDKDLNGQITYYPDSNTYDRRSGSCTFEIQAANGEIIPIDSTGASAADPNGNYGYTYFYKSNLPPGNYILRNTNNVSTSTVTNFTQYESSTKNYGLVREANISFNNNNLNQVSRNNLFLNLQPITNNASIIGQVYIDRNNDGVYNPNGADGNPLTLEDNDVPLKNVKIDLNKVTPFLSKSVRTDENGNYQLTDLPAGFFKIQVDLVQK